VGIRSLVSCFFSLVSEGYGMDWVDWPGLDWRDGTNCLVFSLSLLRRATGMDGLGGGMDQRPGFFSFSASEGYWDGCPGGEGWINHAWTFPFLSFKFCVCRVQPPTPHYNHNIDTHPITLTNPQVKFPKHTRSPPPRVCLMCVCVSDRQTAARVIIDSTQPTRDSQGFKSRTER